MKLLYPILIFSILFSLSCEGKTNIQKKLDEVYKSEQIKKKKATEAAEKKRLLEPVTSNETVEDKAYQKALKLKRLNSLKGTNRIGDWLSRFDEKGQSFYQYLKQNPIMPNESRHTIYILPIGAFRKKQSELIDLTIEYMKIYFNLEVKKLKPLPAKIIPKKAKRTNAFTGDLQFLSTYILDKVLPPRVPKDAVALISFTATDLWPGEGWNFVFGMATLYDSVGVWSIKRFGNPAASPESFRLALLRTLKVATHETGHMFSIEHCIAYECNMNGSNSLKETDRSPLWLCPECLAKIWWISKPDPVKRFSRMAEFLTKHGLMKEAEYYKAAALALKESSQDIWKYQ